jgi:hypothetical protein
VVGDPAAASSSLPGAGGPQFPGVGWTKSVGGPLIDPRLPTQNLAFAVTKNDHEEWSATAFPREARFADAFEKVRPTPADVSAGTDLVLWLSFEAFRREEDVEREWTGSFFPQGLFFGHGPERAPRQILIGGGYGEAENPRARQDWERPSG